MLARRSGLAESEPFELRRTWLSFRRALLELALPIVILGGMLGGVFTVTGPEEEKMKRGGLPGRSNTAARWPALAQVTRAAVTSKTMQQSVTNIDRGFEAASSALTRERISSGLSNCRARDRSKSQTLRAQFGKHLG